MREASPDMPITQLILEYLRVLLDFGKMFLSPQIFAAIVALFFLAAFRPDIKALLLRVAKIKFPGGELSTPQSAKKEETTEKLPTPPSDDVNLPVSLEKGELDTVRELFNAERARAFLWEYRYLNYFLAQSTQRVLDWFATNATPHPTVELFDSMWLPFIPSPQERQAILQALQAHHLINIDRDLITITPKGREYVQWRGPLPQPKA